MPKIPLTHQTYFSREIHSSRIRKILLSHDRERATHMGLWDRFKDAAFSGQKKAFLEDVHLAIHTGNISDRFSTFLQDASIEELEEFFSAKNDNGVPLLHDALKCGRSDVIRSFGKLLRCLPEVRRIRVVDSVLQARDRHGIPGLAMALKNAHTEAHRDAIETFKALLDDFNTPFAFPAEVELNRHHDNIAVADSITSNMQNLAGALKNGNAAHVRLYAPVLQMVPETQRYQFLADLMATSEGESALILAMQNGHGDAIMACKELLEMLPPPQQLKILSSTDRRLNSALSLALKNGHAGAVRAYGELLKLVPEDHRVQLLTARDRDSNTGLSLALRNGHGDAVKAYGGLLKLVPPRYHEKLLLAEDRRSNSGLYWALQNGRNAAITAYREVLESLPPESLTTAQRIRLITGKDANGLNGLYWALRSGHAEAIADYQRLLDLVPMANYTEILGAKDREGRTGLWWASNNGHDAAILVYATLLAPLSITKRAEIICAQGKGEFESISYPHYIEYKCNGLHAALRSGHAEAVAAYQSLLDLLPFEKRAEIIAATSFYGTGLYNAIIENHGSAITAFKSLLHALPETHRTADYLADLLIDPVSPVTEAPLVYYALGRAESGTIEAYLELLEFIPESAAGNILRDIFVPVSMNPGNWQAERANRLLNHMGNKSGRSLLTCIDSLSHKFNKQKIKMMEIMAWQVPKMKISGEQAASILSVWERNPLYSANYWIGRVTLENLIPKIITSANFEKLTADAAVQAKLLNYVASIPAKPAREAFMLHNNGFFVQLMALCSDHPDNAIKEIAQTLYDQYLELPQLRQHQGMLRSFGCVGIRDTDGDNGVAYLFVRERTETINRTASTWYDGLMVNRSQIHDMLSKDKACDWSRTAFVTAGPERINGKNEIVFKTQGQFKADEVFLNFPLFKTTYEIQSRQPVLLLPGLLQASYTNNSGEAELLTKDYTDLFKHALGARTSQEKLTNLGDQATLAKIFGRFTVPNTERFTLQNLPQLNPGHVTTLIEKFQPPGRAITNVERAKILLSIAIVMAQLSSSSHFGTEYESPTALRIYAAALLRAAYESDHSICNRGKYEDYMSRLLGLGGAFTCTGVVAGSMRDITRNDDFCNKMYPVAWA